MLGQTGSGGVAVGVSPGTEAASAAGLADRVLDLGQNLLEVAGLSGQVDAQSAGIAHQRRGQVGLDEVTAVLQQLLEQRLSVSVVGAEVSGLLAVGLGPLGDLLQDVSLRAGHADVRGGIGSSLHNELHAELLAGGLHDRDTTAHGLISQVTGEGDVHKGVTAQLVSGADDQIAASHEVVVAHQIGSGADLEQILMGLAGDAQDVGADLLDLTERLGGAGDGLVDDDGLHVGVISQVHDGLDGGLQLLGEVIGIDGQLDHILTVQGLESLGAAAVVLGLRNGAGHDADVDVALGFRVSGLRRSLGFVAASVGGGVAFAAGNQGQGHGQGKQCAQQSFHTCLQFVFLQAFHKRPANSCYI